MFSSQNCKSDCVRQKDGSHSQTSSTSQATFGVDSNALMPRSWRNQPVSRLSRDPAPLTSPDARLRSVVSQPGDRYEQEADRIADWVMLTPQPQSAYPCVREPNRSQQRRNRASWQTMQIPATDFAEAEVPPIVHEVLRSSGQPLDSVTRADMELRFGHDFSQVRVHTDARASQSAQVVGALAYTVGRDIVMRKGQFQPLSKAGQRLLSHELAHVIQQNGNTTAYSSDTSSLVDFPLKLSAAPTGIYRQQALLEPPLVTQFRGVGQLLPPDQLGMVSPRTPPPNVLPPIATSEPGPPSIPQSSPPASGPSAEIVYFIMRHEGFYAHPDDVSDPYNCTVGYGILLHEGPCVGNESEAHPRFAEAERRFARGMTPERGLAGLVDRVVGVANNLRARLTVPLSQNQFDALVSFAFNTGGLGNLLAHVNRGEYAVIPRIMLQYTGAPTPEGRMAHPHGVAVRRAEEVAIWQRGDYGRGAPRRHHGCRRMIEDCSDREHPRPRVATPDQTSKLPRSQAVSGNAHALGSSASSDL